MIKKKISYWVNGGIALIDRYLISQLLPPFLFSVGLFASLGVAIGNLSDFPAGFSFAGHFNHLRSFK